MKIFSIILCIGLIAINYRTSAQHRIFKYERISTLWDTDSTYGSGNSWISFSPEGKIVMLSLLLPKQIPRFLFYDDVQKSWTKIQLDDPKWYVGHHGMDYTLGMKTVLSYGDKLGGNDRPTVQSIKWILNYGDSLFLDTITLNYYYPSMIQSAGSRCITPSVCYTSIRKFSDSRILFEGQPPEVPFNNYVYRRTNYSGTIQEKLILSEEGGTPVVSERGQYFENSIYHYAIDSETVIAGVKKYYYVPYEKKGVRQETDTYSLLTRDGGETWNTISDTFFFENDWYSKKTSDNQWIFQIGGISYLFSSPRHGVTPKKPIYYGFIDEHMKDVEVHSKYGNGKKGYYCLCNSLTDTTERRKLLIYSIDNEGMLQKYVIPDSVFEYKDIVGNDSVYSERQILYADDTVMYIQVVTGSYTEVPNDYRSKPQLYKIYLKEQINSVAEQPAVTPLQLYPNPTDHILRWNTSSGTAIITDALGRQLIEVPASAMEADVSGLAVGMYYLTIQNGVESVARSFVVVR